MNIDIKKAARMLGTPEATVRRWARQGKLPAREEAGGYFFRESDLVKWAQKRNLTIMDSPKETDSVSPPTKVNLYESMKRGGVFFSLPGETVREILEVACKVIPFPDPLDRATLLDRLLERETLASTGIGNGVAFPHPRYPLEHVPAGGMISTCFLEKEVDFNAVDGMPVFVTFIILSPDTETHLKLLSQLSFRLRDDGFIRFLRECRNGEDLLAGVRKGDRKMLRREKEGGA